MEQTYSIQIIHPSDLENYTSQDDNILELTDVGIIGLDSLCRICANRSDHLIPIYDGEGAEYQLEMKIKRYFPFQIEKTDTLPTHCCYQCASTILTWHELVEASIEADKRLKALQYHTVVQLNQKLENVDESLNTITTVEDPTTGNTTENNGTNPEERSATPVINFGTYYNAQKLFFNQSVNESIVQVKDEKRTDRRETILEHDGTQISITYPSESDPDGTQNNFNECGEFPDIDDMDVVDNLPLSERICKNSKIYTCGTCRRKFKKLDTFNKHLMETLHRPNARKGRRKVQEETRFYCDICDYGFGEYKDMETHRDSHLKRVADTPTDIAPEKSNNNTVEGIVPLEDSTILQVPHSDELQQLNIPEDSATISKIEPNDDDEPQDTLALAVSIIKTELNEYPRIKYELEVPNIVDINSFLSEPKVIDKEVCRICGLPFANRTDLSRHIQLRHKLKRRKKSEIIPQFHCDVCNNGFTRKYDMQKHRKVAHEGVPEKINPKQLKSRQNAELLARCKIEYEGRTHYKCEHCARVIHLSYNFIRHQTVHTGVRAFFCHLCGKSFRMSSGLSRHIKELHYGVKNYECEICGRRFASKNTRDDHMNIHSGARPFVCDQCGKSFKQKASLHVHKIFHTDDKPFVCGTCGKQFRRSTELKVHGWLHTGHKPHVCSTCGSKFRLAQDLKRHVKTHSKDFQVACDVCGARFGQERYLKSHMKTHRKKDPLIGAEVIC